MMYVAIDKVVHKAGTEFNHRCIITNVFRHLMKQSVHFHQRLRREPKNR